MARFMVAANGLIVLDADDKSQAVKQAIATLEAAGVGQVDPTLVVGGPLQKWAVSGICAHCGEVVFKPEEVTFTDYRELCQPCLELHVKAKPKRRTRKKKSV